MGSQPPPYPADNGCTRYNRPDQILSFTATMKVVGDTVSEEEGMMSLSRTHLGMGRRELRRVIERCCGARSRSGRLVCRLERRRWCLG